MKVAVYKTVRELIEVDDKFERCNEIVDDPTKESEWFDLVGELVHPITHETNYIGLDGVWEVDENGVDTQPIVEY